jgi:hypothetical protein
LRAKSHIWAALLVLAVVLDTSMLAFGAGLAEVMRGADAGAEVAEEVAGKITPKSEERDQESAC